MSETRTTTWHTNWPCIWCGETIPKSEGHVRYNGLWEGERQNWGMHRECYSVAENNMAENEGQIWPHEHKRGSLESKGIGA